MSHHSTDKPLAFFDLQDEKSRLVQKMREQQIESELGPTKDFPHGKIVPHDEGGLMFGVTVFNGRVIFDFGKPIRSIGFTREGALELAELIRQRAMQCPEILFPTQQAKKTVLHK